MKYEEKLYLLVFSLFIYFLQDVAQKILSFSTKGPRVICVLSANGAVSNVTIHQPGSSGGLLTYEVSSLSLSLNLYGDEYGKHNPMFLYA